MKFTHLLNIHLGWEETKTIPSDYKKVKHLGKCAADGDMFAAYDETIEIYKGTMEEETLKTNTWYKSKNFSQLVYRTGNENNYAITKNKEGKNFNCYTPEFWQEATEQEVKEALIKLAKKKGFKNIHNLNIKDPYGNVYEKGDISFIDNNFKLIYGETLLLNGVIIFNKGKWAEILEEKQPLTILAIEERLKRLEDKLL